MEFLINKSNKYSSLLVVLYIFFSIVKIYAQINEHFLTQSFILVFSNLLLILPFLFENRPEKFLPLFKFLFFLTIGEAIIVYYDNPILLNSGMVFYLLSKISLLMILKRNRENEKIFKTSRVIITSLSIIFAFSVIYIFYNTASVSFFTSILILLYSAFTTYLFIHIFYFKDNRFKKYFVIGLILLIIHDISGGFNFFHALIDKNFIYSYLFISSGNLILFYGFWKSRNVIFA